MEKEHPPEAGFLNVLALTRTVCTEIVNVLSDPSFPYLKMRIFSVALHTQSENRQCLRSRLAVS